MKTRVTGVVPTKIGENGSETQPPLEFSIYKAVFIDFLQQGIKRVVQVGVAVVKSQYSADIYH